MPFVFSFEVIEFVLISNNCNNNNLLSYISKARTLISYIKFGQLT